MNRMDAIVAACAVGIGATLLWLRLAVLEARVDELVQARDTHAAYAAVCDRAVSAQARLLDTCAGTLDTIVEGLGLQHAPAGQVSAAIGGE
jgi:hypothetical protein